MVCVFFFIRAPRRIFARRARSFCLRMCAHRTHQMRAHAFHAHTAHYMYAAIGVVSIVCREENSPNQNALVFIAFCARSSSFSSSEYSVLCSICILYIYIFFSKYQLTHCKCTHTRRGLSLSL